jgi:hypothetical protein
MDLEVIRQTLIFDASQYHREVERAQRTMQALNDAIRRGVPLQGQVGRMPSVPVAQRELERLRSTLGGYDRSLAQTALAQRRLEAAQRAGIVSTGEAARLAQRIGERFSVASVKAADLRRNMAGLNQSMLALLASSSRLGDLPVPPLLLARGLGAVGTAGALGVGAAAGGIGLALAGERRQLAQQRLESLGAPTDTLERLVELSIRSGSALEDLIGIYGRAQIAGRDFGASQQDLLTLTEGLTAVSRLQGQSFQEVTGSFRQLMQSLAGTRQLEELNSIIEQTPLLAQALARGLEELGVINEATVTELRKSWRNVPQDMLLPALLAGLKDVAAAADELGFSTARSFAAMGTAAEDAAGRIALASGATTLWQTVVEAVRDRFTASMSAMAADAEGVAAQVREGLGQMRPEDLDLLLGSVNEELSGLLRQRDELIAKKATLGFSDAELDTLIDLNAQLAELLRRRGELLQQLPGGGGEAFGPPRPPETFGPPGPEPPAIPLTKIPVEIPGEAKPRAVPVPAMLKGERESLRIARTIADEKTLTAEAKRLGKEREADAERLAKAQERFARDAARSIAAITAETEPEVQRLMAQMTEGVDFEIPAAQLQAMEESVRAALARRDATEEELRLQREIKDAMEAQARAADQLVERFLPGEAFRRNMADLESQLAFLQSPAAGPNRLTPEQATTVRGRATAATELPEPFEDVRGVTDATIDSLIGFSAELATGTAQIEQFGDVLLDVAGTIYRAILEAAVARPAQQAISGVLANLALGAAGGGTVGATTSPAFTTPGGTQIYVPRAAGGPVWPSGSFLVGEAGVELFRPKTPGRIVPTAALAGELDRDRLEGRGAGRGGRSPAPVINLDARVINNSSSATVSQPRVTLDASGRALLQVVVEDAMGASMFGGRMDQAMQQFGGRRRGTRRM